MATYQELMKKLWERNKADQAKFNLQRKGIVFTPEQERKLIDKYWTRQNMYDDVLKKWREMWLSWQKLLTQLNTTTKDSTIPSKVEYQPVKDMPDPTKPVVKKEETMDSLPATSEYFDDMIKSSKDPEATANLVWLKNDYTSFFQRNEEVAKKIDQYFPWLYDMMLQSGQLTNEVGKEMFNKLNVEREMFLQRNNELRKKIEDTYKWNANLISNLYWQEKARAASWAAATGLSWSDFASRARINADMLKAQSDLAKEELEQYKTLASTVDEYMKWYYENYKNSTDQYVIDNYNNLLNMQSGLLSNIKNLEISERSLWASSAEASNLANAAWGQTKPTTNKTGQTLYWWPDNVRAPYNPDIFWSLPESEQQRLISKYWSIQNINRNAENYPQYSSTTGQNNTWWQNFTPEYWGFTPVPEWYYTSSESNLTNKQARRIQVENEIRRLHSELSVLESNNRVSNLYNKQIADTRRALEQLNNEWNTLI